MPRSQTRTSGSVTSTPATSWAAAWRCTRTGPKPPWPGWGHVQARFEEMQAQARELLERGGADTAAVRYSRRVDMRYAGQGYEVPVILPEGSLEKSIEASLRTAFDSAYERRFGSHLDD